MNAQASQVSKYKEAVRINSIDMKEVKLHLTDNIAKNWDIGAKNTIGIHSSEGMGLSIGLTQDLHKQSTTAKVFPEISIDEP
jgi:hypothetical protein